MTLELWQEEWVLELVRVAGHTDGPQIPIRWTNDTGRCEAMAEEQEKNWSWCLSVCMVWGVVGLIVLVVLATMCGVFGT